MKICLMKKTLQKSVFPAHIFFIVPYSFPIKIERKIGKCERMAVNLFSLSVQQHKNSVIYAS